MECPPRRGSENPGVRRRARAALAHGKIGNGLQRNARALDNNLGRRIELTGVVRIRGREARRRRSGGRRWGAELVADHRGEGGLVPRRDHGGLIV